MVSNLAGPCASCGWERKLYQRNLCSPCRAYHRANASLHHYPPRVAARHVSAHVAVQARTSDPALTALQVVSSELATARHTPASVLAALHEAGFTLTAPATDYTGWLPRTPEGHRAVNAYVELVRKDVPLDAIEACTGKGVRTLQRYHSAALVLGLLPPTQQLQHSMSGASPS
ncbi:hypothetical protein ACIBH1_45420 [Nonomuraea sp. NPDC050663]|uniref:hypothetical protein n=1 Tax=Nonomuraea sp. NPDC050663 TaxID=3364370 RepID=UPI003798650A